MRGVVHRVLLAFAMAVAAPAVVAADAPSECRAALEAGSIPQLPNLMSALKKNKNINVLALGSHAVPGSVPGEFYGELERLLEGVVKGVNVEIIYRGYSGELAEKALEQMKTEVAIRRVHLVIWQVGTADGLARVPPEDFRETVASAVDWLRTNRSDIIFVGPRYTRGVAKDQQYQAIRTAVRQIARDKNIIRVGRYEAEELFERRKRDAGTTPSDADISEGGYACMADYLGRAVAAALLTSQSE
jgi:acyl-CoA thioesterase-1